MVLFWVYPTHQMNTSGSSCYTLAADVIKWAWLDILYLVHVLYVAIGAPPPTLLVYYLNVIAHVSDCVSRGVVMKVPCV